MSLRELLRRLREGEPFRHAVVFTIDDGYFDSARVAVPTFAKFDCPLTIFVVSGFLDRKLWFWWDRIQFMFQNTRRSELVVPCAGERIRYTLDSSMTRVRCFV